MSSDHNRDVIKIAACLRMAAQDTKNPQRFDELTALSSKVMSVRGLATLLVEEMENYSAIFDARQIGHVRRIAGMTTKRGTR